MSAGLLAALIMRHPRSPPVDYEALVMGLSPWLYYRFPSSSSGTVCPDAATNGNDADFGTFYSTFTASTTKPSASSLTIVPSVGDKALQSSLKAYGSFASQPTGTGSWTIQAVVKPTAYMPSSRNMVLAVGKAIGGCPILALYPNGTGGFTPVIEDYYVSTPIVPSATIAVDEKAIIHVRYTSGSNLTELFLNGAMIGSATYSWSSLSSSPYRITVGYGEHPLYGYDAAGNPFYGNIDEVAVFRYALTNSEINSLLSNVIA